MSKVITDWKVEFGDTSAKIAGVAADVANLDAATTAATNNATAGFQKAASATAENTARIKEGNDAVAAHKAALKLAEAQLDALRAAYKEMDNAQTRASDKGNQQIAAQIAKLAEQRREIAAINNAIREETQLIDGAKAAIDREASAQKAATVAAKAATAEAKTAAQASTQAATAATAGAQKTGGAFGFLGNIMGNVGGLFAGLFAVNKLKQLGSEIIDVTAEFQRYEAVLTTVFDGNENKAKKQFAALEQFAARTPFQVNEVTDAYVQLQNRGLKPTEQQLQYLGDLAAASGKGYLQVSEAVLNAQAGIYRNLKQFGVTASVDGDKVKLTFRGVTTELEKGSAALSQYLLNLGATKGIAGSTERISKTVGGQISNLKDQFTELFDAIGEGNTGVIASFVAGLSQITKGLTEYFKTIDRKALDASLANSKAYEEAIKARFEAVVAMAKSKGQDVAKVIQDFAYNEDKLQVNQLRTANYDLQAVLERQAKARAIRNPFAITSSAENAKYQEDLDRDGKQELALRTKIKLFQNNRTALDDLARSAQTANKAEKETLGLILDLKRRIKEIDDKREAVTTTREDILKKGGLNDQRKALQDELAILEGKQDKAAADRSGKLKAALAALLAAQLALHKEYNKQVEDANKENAAKLAKLQYDHALEEIDRLRATIVEKEKLAKEAAAKLSPAQRRAAGYTADEGDGKLSQKQQAELDKLRALAAQEYADKIADIERQTNARILELAKDSDEKELAQLRAKFDEEIRLAKKAENDRLVVALQGARERAEALLLQNQALRSLDQGQTLEGNAIKQGAGKVVANLPVADSSLAERLQARIAAARIDAEKNMQRQLLENEIAFNQKRLDLIQSDGTKETEVRRSNIAAAIDDAQKALDKIGEPRANFEDFLVNLLGVSDEDRDKVKEGFAEFANQTLGQLNEFAQAQVDATRAVADDAKKRVQEKQSELQTEIQLNAQGFASNVETKRAELAEAKRARAEALKDQKEAQRAQIILDSIQQGSSLVTAGTKIIEGFSGIPIIGLPLGIAAVSAMLGFFVAAKAKALSAVSAQTLEKGGYVGGRRHSAGGNKFISLDGRSTLEHEEGEFFANRKAASKYGALFEAANEGDENRMIQYLFNDLLKGTGVVAPRRDLPQQMERAQATYQAARTSSSGSSRASQELAELRRDVAAIKTNTRPQRQVIDAGDRIITIDGNRTSIEIKR